MDKDNPQGTSCWGTQGEGIPRPDCWGLDLSAPKPCYKQSRVLRRCLWDPWSSHSEETRRDVTEPWDWRTRGLWLKIPEGCLDSESAVNFVQQTHPSPAGTASTWRWSSRVSDSECPSLRSTRLGDARREAALEACEKHASLLPYPLLLPSLKPWLLQTGRSVMSFDHVRAWPLQSSHGCYNSAAKPSVCCDVGLRSLVGFCQLRKGGLDFSQDQGPRLHTSMWECSILKILNVKNLTWAICRCDAVII